MLNIGDLVTLPEDKDRPFDSFPGIGIFRGESSTSQDCYAIEREDGKTGGAQNGWWNFNKCFADLLIVLGKEGEEVSLEVMMRSKKHPKTVEEWFKIFVAKKFGVRKEKYDTLKQKDLELKTKIETLQKDYNLLVSRTSRSAQRKVRQVEAFLVVLANERIKLAESLDLLSKELLLSLSPEDLQSQLSYHQSIDSIRLDSESHRLIVRTKMVLRDASLKRRRMGQFDIYLDSQSLLAHLAIRNVTWQYREYDHPHIHKGSCCLAGFSSPLEEAEQSGNLIMFIDVLISFLGTITRNSVFVNVKTWFTHREKI